MLIFVAVSRKLTCGLCTCTVCGPKVNWWPIVYFIWGTPSVLNWGVKAYIIQHIVTRIQCKNMMWKQRENGSNKTTENSSQVSILNTDEHCLTGSYPQVVFWHNTLVRCLPCLCTLLLISLLTAFLNGCRTAMFCTSFLLSFISVYCSLC